MRLHVEARWQHAEHIVTGGMRATLVAETAQRYPTLRADIPKPDNVLVTHGAPNAMGPMRPNLNTGRNFLIRILDRHSEEEVVGSVYSVTLNIFHAIAT